jgi:hypothetical protein
MPINGINIGADYNFGFYDTNTGQIIDFGDIQSFKEDAISHKISSIPYNNLPRFGFVPAGYKGSFSIKRVGSSLDSLQIQLVQVFNNGGGISGGYINKVVTNSDLTISRFQYIKAVFWMNQVASGSREKEIVQDVEWMASDLVQIS